MGRYYISVYIVVVVVDPTADNNHDDDDDNAKRRKRRSWRDMQRHILGGAVGMCIGSRCRSDGRVIWGRRRTALRWWEGV